LEHLYFKDKARNRPCLGYGGPFNPDVVTSTLSMMRGHVGWVTGSQSVIGIQHPQETMSWGFVVDGRELHDLRAAVAELGARASGLYDGQRR